MEIDECKLFIGGISWDTNEDRLREYFGAYGEVAEAVIMRDRSTGRARGFGFVVFADPSVAEQVVKEKHTIDGRTVEAKKAVPRDDQHLVNRNNNASSTQGSPGPGRTRKIFVGGLASTVTETDFKNYFEQYGTITDVVVMYDHNTQRPRGFGFITYDSEDAVDRVLQHKTFHELKSKMVEVKRAVPKDPSPGPNRNPLFGYTYGCNRANNILSNYTSIGEYGLRMDGRYSPLTTTRNGFSHFSSPSFVNMEQSLNSSFGGVSNFNSNLGYGRVLRPLFGNNQGGYNTPLGYNSGTNRGDNFLNSPSRNVWGNGGLNTSPHNADSGSYFGSGNGGFGVNWGTGGSSLGYRGGENSYALGDGGFGRNGNGTTTSSFSALGGDYEGFYRNGTWQTTSSDLGNSGSFGYGVGYYQDANDKDPEDYGVGYDISNRKTSRGISA